MASPARGGSWLGEVVRGSHGEGLCRGCATGRGLFGRGGPRGAVGSRLGSTSTTGARGVTV
ncbi:Hypothetical protein AA314_01565 [Archangium gephyra]|uniref:Uncharacterized protein n=1 Tax=Archangium gephyra TaxID=48 RepID=A0AAC8Q2X2_9BACT|nr:Hypothetical protein AA314_01565 [Archangium gephyra]